jgi:predicted Zn-dependent peptidase
MGRRAIRPLETAAIVAWVLVYLTVCGATLADGPIAVSIADMPFEQYRLANGLAVVLAPDPSLDEAAVIVHYDVGSADDPPDKEGLAHLVEHLMFDGSRHVAPGELISVAEMATPQPVSLQTFSLENGLHVVFVERHGFPMVAAQLVIDTSWAMADDVGGRTAYLLAGTFLSPFEHVRQTSAGCGPDGCAIASRGLSAQLAEVLGRIANLAMRAGGDPGAYQQRFATYVHLAEREYGPVQRNMRALMFGRNHRYGEAPSGPVPTLDALKQLRDRSFVPSASTLVVVGDTTIDAVRAALGQTPAPWVPGREARPDTGEASATA